MIAAAQLGYAYLLAGRAQDALRFLAMGLDAAQTTGACWSLANWQQCRAQVHLRLGDVDAARLAATHSVEEARVRRMQDFEAVALRTLGDVEAAASDSKRAMSLYSEALTRSHALGLRPTVAHCHLSFANLYRRTGKRQKAQEHLATATTMYREMGMTYWLEQTAGETVALG
jgi:tetratricopeptide (TPR) repeat protein